MGRGEGDEGIADGEWSAGGPGGGGLGVGDIGHVAGNPDKGRSALDGVEAMDAMTNLMREHIPDRTRIHYVITKGGKAPNVVPDEAEVYYYVRHTDPAIVKATWE